MKRLVGAIVLALLSASFAASQTSPQTQPQSNTEQPELAETERMSQTVVSLSNAGKYEEAFPIAEQVVKTRERLLGKEDERLLLALKNLAVIQLMRGKPSEAKNLLERLLRVYEKTAETNAGRLGEVLDQLGVVYYRLGRAADAERAFKQSLEVRQKALGEDHTDVARALRQLGEFYQFNGDFKKAEPVYQRLVETRKKQAVAEPLVDALERYACLMRKTNREQEADALEQQARDVIPRRGITPEMVSAGVVNGRAVTLVQPPYPYEAIERRVQGKVTVRILINRSGNVLRACAVEGPRVFMQAAESAAYRSKFTPTVIGGKPVQVTGKIIYNFVAR